MLKGKIGEMEITPTGNNIERPDKADTSPMTNHPLTAPTTHPGSISQIFYLQRICAKIPKAQKDTDDLTCLFCAFVICERKSCTYNVGEIMENFSVPGGKTSDRPTC
jgi:hypothetical protein